MQTSPVRLIEYFEGRKQNIIPLFQRPYRWTKDNWERLWKDLAESENWTPSAIDQRSERLAQRALKIWRGPLLAATPAQRSQ
jgi:hypothetical protein